MGEYENERDSDGLWTVLDCLLGLVRGEDVPPAAKVLVTCHTGTVDIHNVFKNDTASFLSLEGYSSIGAEGGIVDMDSVF